MKIVTLEYSGKKPYTDRTILRNLWAPGDVKAIPAADAKQLLRFGEFKVSEKAAKKSDTEKAVIAAKLKEQDEKTEDNVIEQAHMQVESMDKNALEAYAKEKYSVELDKRRSLSALRLEVLGLIDQYGVQ